MAGVIRQKSGCTYQGMVMTLTRDTKIAIALGAVGAAIGYSLLVLNVRHDFDTAPLVLMLFGAVLIVLCPLVALLWTLHQKRKLPIRRYDVCCAVVMLVGLLGPSRFEPLVPYRLGDFFGLLFWSGFLTLVGLMTYRWRKGGGGLQDETQ
tara:strand:+ start:1699 stop:2148 length:450 start_codon:yes stop_codon:yes gene_type:complete